MPARQVDNPGGRELPTGLEVVVTLEGGGITLKHIQLDITHYILEFIEYVTPCANLPPNKYVGRTYLTLLFNLSTYEHSDSLQSQHTDNLPSGVAVGSRMAAGTQYLHEQEQQSQ